VDNVEQLPLEKTTVAQALKKAGYATGMFGKWHLGQQGEHHPSRRGFDEAIVSMGKHFDFKTIPPVDYAEGMYLADFLTDKAIDFMRRNKANPFFLYLPHFGVHAPREAKKELIEKFKVRKPAGGHDDPVYAAMIYSVDESVGRVLRALEELKLAENTLVIFSSDNGGVGGYVREGLKQAGDVTDNAPLRGGKGMLYEGGIRVPWIFWWPGTIAAGKTCEEPIISVDLFPTLLDLAGGERARTDGVSVVELLKSAGKRRIDREAIYWHFPGYLGAGQDKWRTTPVGVIRAGDWKLMEFFEDNRVELYNLREDIGERSDLASKRPERANELRSRLNAWRKEVGAQMPVRRGI
jgi:arylsulfatase A-like enzyme